MTSRIYVACLAAYNNGRLHGAWIDIDACTIPDEIHDSIRAVLDTSPEPDAEEWAVHDYEGFAGYRLSEHPDLESLCQLAEAIEVHGETPMRCALANFGDDIEQSMRALENGAYLGAYRNVTDWAENYLEDTGMLQKIPDDLRRYFDFTSWARDAEMSGDIWSEYRDGQTHIFSGHP